MSNLSQSFKKPDYPSFKDKSSLVAYARFYWRDLVLFALFLLTLPIMELLNRPYGTVRSLEIAFDSKIPLLTWTVIIYNSWAPLIVVLALFYFLRDRRLFRSYLITMIVGQLMADMTFPFFQTTIPRPYEQVLAGTDIFSRLLAITYRYDNHFCGFPSIHVILCTLTIIFVWQLNDGKKWLQVLVSIYFIAIAITTVTTKQHVVLDIPGGILYALVAFLVAKPLIRLVDRSIFSNPYR